MAIGFVGLSLEVSWDEITINRADPNRPFAIGLEGKPKKIRYPDFLGYGLLRKRKLQAWLRHSFFAEPTSDDPQQRRLGVLRTVAELQLKGYPTRVLRDAVAGISQLRVSALRATAQRYLMMCKRVYGSDGMAITDILEMMWEPHLPTEAFTALRVERLQAVC